MFRARPAQGMSAEIRNVAWVPPPEDENACPGAYPRWVPGRVWIVRTEAGANLSERFKGRQVRAGSPGCCGGYKSRGLGAPEARDRFGHGCPIILVGIQL